MNGEELLRIVRGFQPACVVAAAADLEVFEAIGGGAVDLAEAARRVRGDPRGVEILLDALAALELLEKRDGRYSVPPPIRPLLTPGGKESVLAMVQHLANCLRRWARLAETIRAGEVVGRTPSVRGEEGDRESFIEAMDVVNRNAADGLVGDIGPIPVTHLLDVGGGSGTWTLAWLRAHPAARATLFDLPAVVPMARARFEAAGVLDRVTLVPGDFYADPLPEGTDLAWVSAIVHQNSREQNRDLYRKVLAALAPGGRILIRDIVMDETKTKPVGGALFAVNMLSATPGGGTFTFAELEADLLAAGFTEVEQLREDEWMHAIVCGRKPEDS